MPAKGVRAMVSACCAGLCLAGVVGCTTQSRDKQAGSCGSPVLTQASVRSANWRVSTAFLVVVDASGAKTSRPEAASLALQAFVDASARSAAVDASALVRAVAQATDLPLLETFSATPVDDTAIAEGRYVVYSGAKQTVVDYAGSCDQRPISGSLTAFQVGTEGVLDCSTEPSADSLGDVARKWCDDA